MVTSLANTNWYLEELQRRTGPWMTRYYRGVSGDSLPPYVVLEGPVGGAVGPIHVTLDPHALGRPYLDRSELALLEIIKDQLGKRPIYFSMSAGSVPDQLGLSSYLVGEGLVRRLEPAAAHPSGTMRPIKGRRFLEFPATEQSSFGGYSGCDAAECTLARRSGG